MQEARFTPQIDFVFKVSLNDQNLVFTECGLIIIAAASILSGMAFNVPSIVAPSCDFFLMQDGKTSYLTGRNSTTLHEVDLEKNKPKLRLLYANQNNPKSLIAIAGALHGTVCMHSLWRDPASGSLCVIEQAPDVRCFRFSEDKTSLEMLGTTDLPRGTAFALSDGSPALWESLPFTNQNKVHILELRRNRVEIAETIVLPSVKFQFSRMRGSTFGADAFDRAGDGTCYTLAEGRLYQRLPDQTIWTHFSGVGGTFNQPAARAGPPLTLELTSFMSISAGPNGDVLLCDSNGLRIFYLTRDGKKSFLFTANCFSTVNGIHWSYSAPRLFYLSTVKVIYKLEIPEDILAKVHVAAEALPLSSLFQSHSEISDAVVQLKDGSVLQLHRCILSARCPKFLKWIETRPDVEDSIMKTILRYLYDGEVPSDVRNEIPPFEWIRLGEVASALSLPILASRCEKAFGRALFYADPEVCISSLISVAKLKNKTPFLSLAQSIILSRHQILIDRAHQLTEHPNILAWFASGVATKLDQKHHRTTVGLKELGLEWPGDNADRALYASDMSSLFDNSVKTDMVLGSVPCHRAVLVPRCPFVATALSSGFIEQTSFVIKLSDETITESVLRRLLRYLYTLSATSAVLGEDAAELADILELADFLQLHAHIDLIEYCGTQIRKDEVHEPRAAKKRTRSTFPDAEPTDAAPDETRDPEAVPDPKKRKR
jgi:hypothetical protein